MQMEGTYRLNSPARRERDRVARRERTPDAPLVGGTWGWLPLLSLIGAVGLLLIALGFTGARLGTGWRLPPDPLFWVGLVLLFAPIAARLLATGTSRHERIGLVVLFGMALYLVKMLRYPDTFTLHDEFLHWRTADDIIRSGTLFGENPLLPVSALYPGLEIVTSGLASATGLSVFVAGTLVLAAGRLVLALALFLFYEQVGRSARLAGIAALLYLINPKLIFFDAQFSYESLALPLTALLFFLLARRARAGEHERLGLTLGALLALGALVVTHHLTSFAATGFLLLWAAIAALSGRRARSRPSGPGGVALLSTVLCASWLVLVATLVVGYLAPNIEGSVRELLRLIGGETTSRQLFLDPTGRVAPLWERVNALASTLLLLVGLPFGLYRIWRRYRPNPLALALALAALAYPASLAFRFTQAGGEASDRAAGALFFAIAFVLAAAVARLRWPRTGSWFRHSILTSLATALFLGEVIVGTGPSWMRLPGPYLVSSDARSIEPRGIAAARWTLDTLGPGNRIGADRINRLLLGTYGEQYVVAHVSDGIDISPLFFSLGYGLVQQDIVQQTGIRYLVVDRRLSDGLPGLGIYIEAPESEANRHTQPLDPAALAKFDRLLGISRLYDNGDIVIYQIGAQTREP